MKKTYNLLIMIIFSSLCAFSLKAQSPTLEIQKKDQSVVQTPLSNLRKLTFGNDAMTVHYSNGQTGDIALSDISKMVFGTVSGVKNLRYTNTEILVYPNPVSDYLYVKTTDNQTIQIMNISGATVISQKASDRETQIHIADLAKGIYILKLDHKVAKFTKL